MSVVYEFERWGLYHSITVKELRASLADLDDDLILWPNEVRNLTVLKLESGVPQMVGYIDLGQRATLEWTPPEYR